MAVSDADKRKLDEIRRKAAFEARQAARPAASIRSSAPTFREPLLSKLLYILAIAAFIFGLALYNGYAGKRQDALALIFLISGIVEAALFWSFGLALSYLKGIYENTRD